MSDKQMVSKPEKDPVAAAIERNPCAMCRKMFFIVCKGHGAGGGGGGGGGEGKSEDLKIVSANALQPGDEFFKFIQGADGVIKVVDEHDEELSSELEGKLLFYNFQELFKDKLEIDSNPNALELTIQIKQNLPSEEKEVLQKFLKLLMQRCDQILAEPKNKCLVQEGYKAQLDEKKGQLVIHIPDKKLYHDVVSDLSRNAPVLYAQAKQLKKDGKRFDAPIQGEEALVVKKPKVC